MRTSECLFRSSPAARRLRRWQRMKLHEGIRQRKQTKSSRRKASDQDYSFRAQALKHSLNTSNIKTLQCSPAVSCRNTCQQDTTTQLAKLTLSANSYTSQASKKSTSPTKHGLSTPLLNPLDPSSTPQGLIGGLKFLGEGPPLASQGMSNR